jgi:hypothetical protein
MGKRRGDTKRWKQDCQSEGPIGLRRVRKIHQKRGDLRYQLRSQQETEQEPDTGLNEKRHDGNGQGYRKTAQHNLAASAPPVLTVRTPPTSPVAQVLQLGSPWTTPERRGVTEISPPASTANEPSNAERDGRVDDLRAAATRRPSNNDEDDGSKQQGGGTNTTTTNSAPTEKKTDHIRGLRATQRKRSPARLVHQHDWYNNKEE